MLSRSRTNDIKINPGMKNRHLTLTTMLIVAGTLLLMIPALINGYPIVYSDTSTYIAAGFGFETPVDRPITYGLFLWLTSLAGVSLWLTIAIQSLILSWLIFLLTGLLYQNIRQQRAVFFLLMLVLALFTPLSWTASQLMPDIFTPIMALAAVLILFGWHLKGLRILLYFVFALAATMHLSHVTFGFVFLLAILIFRQLNLFIQKKTVPIQRVIILLFISLASISAMGSAMAKSRHVFLMGAMVEHGIAQKYLAAHCDEKRWQICAYSDQFPEKAWQFVWDEKSPLYKLGGWEDSRTEFNEIIKGTLTEPRFIWLHIRESLKATADQLFKFKAGDGNGIFGKETLLYMRVEEYFPQESENYLHSKQTLGRLSLLGIYNHLATIMVVISLLGLVWMALKPPLPTPLFRGVEITLLLAVMVNAWACGTFAGAIDRLGAKMIWLIPMLAVIQLSLFFLKRSNNQWNNQ